MPDDLATLFLQTSARELTNTVKTVNQCLDRLTDDQVWSRGAVHENAIGNLVLHLCGNLRQRIIHGVGSKPDIRVRDAEFSASGGHTRAELLAMFQSIVDEASDVIRSLQTARLLETIHPQGRATPIAEEIYHIITHAHHHVGQIVFATKQLAATDLDLTIPRPR